MVVFLQITHSVIAIADDRLSALGQTTLCALHQCCFGRLACLVWRPLPCHVPLVLGSVRVWHLSGWKTVSENCHPDAASCIPEGTDCLVVGRPPHVQAVDLEGERRARSHHVVPLKLWEQRSEVRDLHVFPENTMSFQGKTDCSKQSWPIVSMTEKDNFSICSSSVYRGLGWQPESFWFWWVDGFSVCSRVCLCVLAECNSPFWD